MIHTDTFYTGIKLALFLITKQAYLIGTINNSRVLPKLRNQSPLATGENIKLAKTDGIVVCRWRDS